MTVRALDTGDIPRVLKIQAVCPEAASWSEADYRRLEGRECSSWQTIVAVKDEQIGGFLTSTETGDLEILNLAVDPDHRRQGVAGILVRKLLRQIAGPLFLRSPGRKQACSQPLQEAWIYGDRAASILLSQSHRGCRHHAL